MHDGCKLGIGVFADACAIVIAMLDRLHRLAFEAICDLLKRPALAINQRRVHELLGQRIDLVPVWVFRIDPIDLKAKHIGENLVSRLAARIA